MEEPAAVHGSKAPKSYTSEKWIGCYLFPASQCFCLFYVLAAAVFKLHGFFAALIIGLVAVDLIFWFVNTLSIFQCAVSFGDTLPQWGSPLNLLAKILLWRGFSIIVELGILGALVIVQTTKHITVTFSMIAIGLSIVLFGGLGTWLLYSFRNRLLEEPVAQDTPRIRDQTPISQDTPIQSAGPTIAYPPTERSAGSQSSRISSQTPKHKIAAPPNWRQMQKIVEGDGPLEPREGYANPEPAPDRVMPQRPGEFPPPVLGNGFTRPGTPPFSNNVDSGGAMTTEDFYAGSQLPPAPLPPPDALLPPINAPVVQPGTITDRTAYLNSQLPVLRPSGLPGNEPESRTVSGDRYLVADSGAASTGRQAELRNAETARARQDSLFEAPVDPVPVPEDQPDYRYRAEHGVPSTSEQPVQPENPEYANNRF